MGLRAGATRAAPHITVGEHMHGADSWSPRHLVGANAGIPQGSPEHTGTMGECVHTVSGPSPQWDQRAPDAGILRSSLKWTKAYMGIWMRRHRGLSWHYQFSCYLECTLNHH